MTVCGTLVMSFEKAAGKLQERKPFLVTMSYRAVLANWFDDAFEDHHKAIPNGSGVSFGMSILREDFGTYARACKLMKKPPPGTPVLADLDDKLKALEAVLTKQLRLEPEELRTFMRRAPSSDSKVDSYLIESAFAFTAPVDLTIAEHRPQALLELDPVKQLVEKRTRGTALRLQVIRLRIRIGRDEDKSRNLIRLGYVAVTPASSVSTTVTRPTDATGPRFVTVIVYVAPTCGDVKFPTCDFAMVRSGRSSIGAGSVA